MAVDVYWGSGSPFAWRVLLTLELKQVPYESHLLECSKREHKSPEMLAMNPRGKVPVLQSVSRASPKETAAALRFELLPFAERFPGLARWCGQMEALPGYDRTYPPH
jgi:glutathione S-transferase